MFLVSDLRISIHAHNTYLVAGFPVAFPRATAPFFHWLFWTVHCLDIKVGIDLSLYWNLSLNRYEIP